MRRFHPWCLLAAVLVSLSGCGESPSRPSVVTDRPVNPPKTSARYIQVPWDISLFFNIPGGAVVAGATTAATPGAAAEGDNLTGTYSNSNGFAGTLTGVLTGTLENGTFNGSLLAITPSGCTAERRYSGSVNTEALNWSPGNHVNDCNGTSPLTGGIQVVSAPPTAPPPCTYSSTVSATSFPAAGGNGTITVTAGTGCLWFATSSAGFVTVSASQGTGNGSVQFTVAANTSTTERTAIVAVAGQSVTITQAGAPAPPPPCRYTLNGSAITVDAAGALAGVDMRAPAGCAWQAQSDSSWLRITSGAGGSGNGTISLAVDANPTVAQRVGQITTTDSEVFTVTQLGIGCTFTVTPERPVLPFSDGTTTVAVAASASVCPWTAMVSPDAPWMTITAGGGTGNGTVSLSFAANPDPVNRTGVLTVAGQTITLTQTAAPCVFTLTPSTTSVPAAGGRASIGVATHPLCVWGTRLGFADPPWITITDPGAGEGTGTVALSFAANTTALARTQSVFFGPVKTPSSVMFTQAGTTLGSLTGTVTNSVNGQPVPGATLTLTPVPQGAPLTATTSTTGAYTFTGVAAGTHNLLAQMTGFEDARAQVTITAAQTATQNLSLVPRPVNLVISWNPNPTSVNPQNISCGAGEVYCWESQTAIAETAGTAAPITTLTLHFYRAGVLVSSVPGTWQPATIPGGGRFDGTGRVTSPSPEGGEVDFEYAGIDAFGRAFSFRSPRLVLTPFILGLTNRAQPAVFGGGVRPANPAPAGRR